MKKRLRRRLAALGWDGSLEEACLNIAYQYLIAAFDPRVLRRFMNEDGTVTTPRYEHRALDLVWASTSAMLDEAESAGRLNDLAPPSIKTPEQILSMLGRRQGQD